MHLLVWMVSIGRLFLKTQSQRSFSFERLMEGKLWTCRTRMEVEKWQICVEVVTVKSQITWVFQKPLYIYIIKSSATEWKGHWWTILSLQSDCWPILSAVKFPSECCFHDFSGYNFGTFYTLRMWAPHSQVVVPRPWTLSTVNPRGQNSVRFCPHSSSSSSFSYSLSYTQSSAKCIAASYISVLKAYKITSICEVNSLFFFSLDFAHQASCEEWA